MMQEEDRRKIFWLLKKATSYTSWKTLADAWVAFVQAWEWALKNAKLSDPELEQILTKRYKRFLDGQIAFEQGLFRLRQGNKSVFRANSVGYLRATLGPLDFADRVVDPIEYVYDWAKNRDEIFQRFDLVKKRQNAIVGIFEQEDRKAPAPYRADDALTFMDHGYIPPGLSEVPSPTKITTFTGREVPYDGIWEPEWNTSLELEDALRARPADVEKGCMNYLIGGTRAPYYRNNIDESAFQVTWRLIWEDARYKDGKIPEEEKAFTYEDA